MVGAVFLSEGIQKFLFPEALGAGRFEKLGIPAPHILGPFVGGVEIVFGTLILIGFLTRLSAIPLLVTILVAIATTKFPMLMDKGIWPTLHEGRADYSMLMGLLFIIFSGAGPVSLDALRFRQR